MEYKKNNEIFGTDILLINESTGKPVKTLLVIAKNMAREKGLDIVQVGTAEGDIPVCKIMDYSKFLYQQKKKIKETAKNQVSVGFKQLKFGPNISDHDLDYRIKKIKEFILHPNKVKITIEFHGRQKLHQSIGEKLLEKIIQELATVAEVIDRERSDNREISIILAPLNHTSKRQPETIELNS